MASADAMTHVKLATRANMKGEWFEVKMAAIFLLRGINSGRDFQLASNVEGAGAMDDIVFRFRTPDGVWHACFYQLKHKATAKLNRDLLINVKGDFALAKYFASFMEIKRLCEAVDKNVLFDGTFDACHFGIITNAPLHQGKGGVETRDQPSVADEYLQIGSGTKFNTSLTEEMIENIYSELKQQETKKTKHSVIDNEDDAKDFLRRLKLYTGQPSEDQLDDVIKQQLIGSGISTDVDSVQRIFLERVKIWWQQNVGVILDQSSALLLEAQAEAMLPHVEKLSRQQVDKFHLDVKFLECETECMKDACAVNVVVDGDVRLASCKLLQTLDSRDVVCLGARCFLREQEAVMSVWRHGMKNTLVVLSEDLDDGNLDDVCNKLIRVLREDNRKRFVLVSSAHDPLTTTLRRTLGDDVIVFKDTFHVTQFDQDTIAAMFQKEFTFQGHPTTLGAVIGEDIEMASNFLTKDNVEAILTRTELFLGQMLPPEIHYYISRTIQMNNIMRSTIFSDNSFSGKIKIKGAKSQDIEVFLQTSDERRLIGKFQEQSEGLLFHGLNEKSFTDRRNEASCNVHYLELVDKKLVWKQSEGSIDFIKKHLDPSTASWMQETSERVVLLVAEPGMGKSTQLIHEAQRTKLSRTASWVVHISLNDHATLLAKTKEEDLTAETFLSSALRLHELSALDQALFTFSMHNSGNMYLFLDGFDEISPKYVEKCSILLSSIFETRVQQVWISSRHSMKDTLESSLSTLAMSLLRFSEDDQRRFLLKYWGTSTGLSQEDLNEFITKLLLMTAQSINDKEKNFTGIPLQTQMLAEVFQDHAMDKTKVLPKKLNILELIEIFVEKKYITYFMKTHKINDFNTDFEDLLEEQRELFIEKHVTAALVLLLEKSDLQSLRPAVLKKCDKFFVNIKSGVDKTGIVDRVTDGKPAFIHKVFAEYFLALWFVDNYEDNADAMNKILLGQTFGVVRSMFDRMLARDNKLHGAVLNSDVTAVDDILREGRDVDERDKGGRTALHLAVTVGLHLFSQDDANITVIEILMSHKARADLEDEVLRWTAVQYADATGQWAEIDALLKHEKIDILQFPSTKDKMDDENIWEIVLQHDHANVLTLLCNLGLHINSRFTASYDHPTLLQTAAHHGSNRSVRVLLDRASQEGDVAEFLETKDDRDNNALISASQNGQLAVVEMLLDTQGDDARRRDYVNTHNRNSESALWRATCFGYPDIVAQLLKRGGNALELTSTGATGLMQASSQGRISVVRALLSSFPDDAARADYVNMHADNGENAIIVASVQGHCDVVAVLKTSGGVVTDHDRLMIGCQQGNTSAVVDLLASYPDAKERAELINRRNRLGLTVMWYVSMTGRREMIELLIRASSGVFPRDEFGRTELMKAIRFDNTDLMVMLLNSFTDPIEKADYVNALDYGGLPALWYALHGRLDILNMFLGLLDDFTVHEKFVIACRRGHLDVVESLLATFKTEEERFVFVNAAYGGERFIWWAAWFGFHHIVAILIREGADRVNLGNDSGLTLLTIAVIRGNLGVVEVLLDTCRDYRERGEMLNARDREGRSVLTLAEQMPSFMCGDIIPLLVAAGAKR